MFINKDSLNNELGDKIIIYRVILEDNLNIYIEETSLHYDSNSNRYYKIEDRPNHIVWYENNYDYKYIYNKDDVVDRLVELSELIKFNIDKLKSYDKKEYIMQNITSIYDIINDYEYTGLDDEKRIPILIVLKHLKSLI